MKNLFFAVHPDDETLGAGGTILKYKDMGDENYWCLMSCMGTAFSEEKRISRLKEISLVEKEYGFKKVYSLPFETMKLDTVNRSTLINELGKIVNEIKPERIFIPFKYDAHSDHKVSYEALSSFFKSFRYPFIKEIYAMETISETDFANLDGRENFSPNCFFDISKYFDEKMKIMNIYASEMGEHPFPRSIKTIEALATLRGSLAGVNYAEAFMLIKKIQ